MADGLLDRIGRTLRTAGSGIGDILAAGGQAYAPPDMNLTRNQQMGLLGSRLGDMMVGPRGEMTNNTPAYLDNIRRENELARRRGVMDSPQIQGLLGDINNPTLSALLEEQVASGDVTGALNNLFNYEQQQSQKQAMLDSIGSGLMSPGPMTQRQQSLLDVYSNFPDAASIQQAEIQRLETLREQDEAAKDRGFSIYDNFKSDIEPFQEILPYFETIRGATAEPSAAGDLGLIFAYMKMLDPGSVVREGEFAVAANSGGIPDRVIAQIQNAQSGQRLSPAVRKDFAETAQRELEGRRKTYNNALDLAYARADATGVDRNYVLPIDQSYDTSIGEDCKTLALVFGEENEANFDPSEWARNAIRMDGSKAQIILEQRERFPDDDQRALEEASRLIGYPETLTGRDADRLVEYVNSALDALEDTQ